MNVKQVFQEFRAPSEAAAEDRARSVVRSAYLDRTPRLSRRSRVRLLIGPAFVLLAGGLALSPAGASVRHWIGRELGVPHPAAALFSLPAPGRVLVSGPGGTWIISADGSKRRLGSWRQASWSPHGRFVGVAATDELAVLDPAGTPRWTLDRPAAGDPRWYAPSGYRIAYLSGTDLRVVAGDGTGDHRLAAGVAPVAPAWRPAHPYQLAYITGLGTLVVRDADTGRVAWTAGAANARALAWAATGENLLVLGRTHATIYNQTGRRIATISVPADAPILDGSLSPDGRRLALVRGGTADDIVLANVPSSKHPLRRVLSGVGLRQLAWSPNGRWLLVTWPAANEWVFVRVLGRPRIEAVGRIAEQFTPGRSPHGFPRLDGWCCTAAAGSG